MRNPAIALRLRLLAWSLPLAIAAELGIALFSLWITSISVIVVTVGVPLTLASTFAVRWFADRHRSWAANVLGEAIPRPYLLVRPGAGVLSRLWTIIRDPATWRDSCTPASCCPTGPAGSDICSRIGCPTSANSSMR
jgi:hypothetical protein